MKNFGSLFIAYLVVWAIFFTFEISISRRLSRLRDELERLKDRFRQV